MMALTAGNREAQFPLEGERRNVVLICCDALRGGLGKSAGMQFDVCPPIEELGAAGMTFRHAYCTMPLCVPSRISMLTGGGLMLIG